MLQQRRIAGMQHGKAVVVHHGVEHNHHEIEHKFEVRAPAVGCVSAYRPALPCSDLPPAPASPVWRKRVRLQPLPCLLGGRWPNVPVLRLPHPQTPDLACARADLRLRPWQWHRCNKRKRRSTNSRNGWCAH